MQANDPHTDRLTELDNALFNAIKGIDILSAVAPLNYQEQKRAFFESQFSRSPEFVYASHDIDTFKKKRELFNLPIDELPDEDLVNLYSGIIESYVDKVDQFKSIGTPKFLYDSMRYFGEPSDKDIRNANFILHLPDSYQAKDSNLLAAPEIVSRFEQFAQKEGYEYKIKLDDSMIANALVSGLQVKVNGAAQVSEFEVNALAHHELGVHLLTTINGRNQPLRVLSVGCPVNTQTQEGLAILSEYLAGYLTLSRLKILALRVLAVDSMIREKDFKKTFLLLREQHNTQDDLAFTITARVYRGGGFTKDYLYLKGLHEILNAYETDPNFNYLLSGKVSLDYLPMITRLIDKQYLVPPKLMTPAFAAPRENDAIHQFITHAIK